jgi:hypothetical protein
VFTVKKVSLVVTLVSLKIEHATNLQAVPVINRRKKMNKILIVAGVVVFLSGCDTSNYDTTEDSGIWDTDSESDASVEDASVDGGVEDASVLDKLQVCHTNCVLEGTARTGSYSHCAIETFLCEHICAEEFLYNLDPDYEDKIGYKRADLRTEVWSEELVDVVIFAIYNLVKDTPNDVIFSVHHYPSVAPWAYCLDTYRR